MHEANKAGRGSFYLESKVFRAWESLDLEYTEAGKKTAEDEKEAEAAQQEAMQRQQGKSEGQQGSGEGSGGSSASGSSEGNK